jgi:hypothetical protein
MELIAALEVFFALEVRCRGSQSANSLSSGAAWVTNKLAPVPTADSEP